MNIPLYYSSALMGALILLASLISYSSELAVLYQITYTGIITSILNHMSNSDIAKYTDRITIVLASFIYIYYTFFIQSKPIQIIIFTLLAIAISCFFFSKLAIALSFDNTRTIESQWLHMSAHGLVLFIFVMIAYDYSFRERSATK
jgi:Na+/proline symporter